MNAQLIDVETGGHLWAERFETADLKGGEDSLGRVRLAAWPARGGAAVKIPANLGEAYFYLPK